MDSTSGFWHPRQILNNVLQLINCLEDELGVDPHHDHDDRDGLLTDGITWMSPDQLDLLSDVEGKAIIKKMITSITASFDQSSKKHQIDVEFSETVSRWLAPSSVDQQPLADEQELPGKTSAALCVSEVGISGGDVAKMSGGNRIKLAADQAYSVTVE